MRFSLVFFTLSLYFCGILGQSNLQRRFHYGQEAVEADPFFATLLRKPPFCALEYKCGGTWIHEKYVLSTAYCLKYHDINRVGYLTGPVTNWANDLRVYKVLRKHFFGNYSLEGDKKYQNDIGLLYVSIMKFQLPPGGSFPSIFDGWGNPDAIQTNQVVLYGFGRTENDNYAPKLKYLRGTLHFADDYFYGHCKVPSCDKGQSFCFEPQGAKERADNGDMGSPVYYRLQDPDNPNPTEKRVLIGILSDYHWDPRNMILTNLTYYKSFIDQFIKG